MNKSTQKIFLVTIVLIMLLFHNMHLSEASSPPSLNVNFTRIKLSQFSHMITLITGESYEFKPINNKEMRVTIFANFAEKDATQFFCLVLKIYGLAILDDGKTIVPVKSDENKIQVSKCDKVEIPNHSVDEKEIDTNLLLSDLTDNHAFSMRDSVTVKQDIIMIKDGDIQNFIWLTSEITGKNIVANQEVIGQVSLDIPYPVTQKEFYQLFLNTLQKSGYKAVNTGMFLTIEKK